MSKSRSYHSALIESLKDPLEAAMYLEVVLEEGDSNMIRKAFANLIEARGGIQSLPDDVREHFLHGERQLQETGEIEFSLLQNLLKSLGLKIGLIAASPY